MKHVYAPGCRQEEEKFSWLENMQTVEGCKRRGTGGDRWHETEIPKSMNAPGTPSNPKRAE